MMKTKNIFHMMILSGLFVSTLTYTGSALGSPKKLTCPQTKLLNMVLDHNLQAIIRTKVTCAKAAQAIKEITKLEEEAAKTHQKLFTSAQEEQLFINQRIKSLIDPVRKFLELVKEQKSIITPIIKESLNIKDQNDAQHSYMLKFIDSVDNAEVFFDTTIKTATELKEASIEFITLFGDIMASLRPETIKACDDLIKKYQTK